ncbi:uncharacterized protein [Nicotiana sylvestris]|uniref:uncharacterized protein n=1 Tax=Nicotiana sylvestris TaxID=4096 RepID=UPI00388C7D5E
MFEQMMKKNADSDAQLASHNTSIQNLEVQLFQISQSLNTLPKRDLPSDMVVNPKGGNNTVHAMVVITRSDRGRVVNTSKQKEVVSDEVEVHDDDVPIVYEKVSEENLTAEVRIDIHDNEVETQDDVNPSREYALCDLGESINLMPYSVFKTLGIGQPRATSVRLQMAAKTIKRPLGIIDDVLVLVDKFILPANFVILDCKVDYVVPIILGRPFLATGKELVDVEAGELTFRVGDEKVIFHVCKSMRQPNSTEVCSFANHVMEVIVDDTSAIVNVEDSLEAVLLNLDVNEDECRVECVNALHVMGSYSYEPVDAILEVLQRRKKAIG